jgi:hypothetical protein
VRLDERGKSWAVCKTTGGIAVNRPRCQSELIELRDNPAKVWKMKDHIYGCQQTDHAEKHNRH